MALHRIGYYTFSDADLQLKTAPDWWPSGKITAWKKLKFRFGAPPPPVIVVTVEPPPRKVYEGDQRDLLSDCRDHFRRCEATERTKLTHCMFHERAAIIRNMDLNKGYADRIDDALKPPEKGVL